jgi:hypothetical protein
MQQAKQPDNSIATIIAIAQEATRGWLEMVTECRELEKKRGEDISQYMEKMRIQITRNYRMLMKKIEEGKTETESKEQIAKKWIRDNLEEAQQFIDNIVGIKGITEDPLKVAAEIEGLTKLTPHTDTTNVSMSYGWNVIAANTAGTLQREFVDDKKEKSSTSYMSLLPHEELYGY